MSHDVKAFTEEPGGQSTTVLGSSKRVESSRAKIHAIMISDFSYTSSLLLTAFSAGNNAESSR